MLSHGRARASAETGGGESKTVWYSHRVTVHRTAAKAVRRAALTRPRYYTRAARAYNITTYKLRSDDKDGQTH